MNAQLKPGVVTKLKLVFRPNNTVSASANFVGNLTDVFAGSYSTYARFSDGTVRSWGTIPPEAIDTGKRTKSPSAARNVSYGTIVGWRLPIRAGAWPVAK